jgi:hypothetical protein
MPTAPAAASPVPARWPRCRKRDAGRCCSQRELRSGYQVQAATAASASSAAEEVVVGAALSSSSAISWLFTSAMPTAMTSSEGSRRRHGRASLPKLATDGDDDRQGADEHRRQRGVGQLDGRREKEVVEDVADQRQFASHLPVLALQALQARQVGARRGAARSPRSRGSARRKASPADSRAASAGTTKTSPQSRPAPSAQATPFDQERGRPAAGAAWHGLASRSAPLRGSVAKDRQRRQLVATRRRRACS